jgi:hypothetical protein
MEALAVLEHLPPVEMYEADDDFGDCMIANVPAVSRPPTSCTTR